MFSQWQQKSSIISADPSLDQRGCGSVDLQCGESFGLVVWLEDEPAIAPHIANS